MNELHILFTLLIIITTSCTPQKLGKDIVNLEKIDMEFNVKEYTNNLIEAYSEHKGIMPPIENYRLRILGNGKVVALENLGKYKGQGVLTAEAKNSDTLFQNYIMLHIPKGSKDFEIVRINSQMASVEEE